MDCVPTWLDAHTKSPGAVGRPGSQGAGLQGLGFLDVVSSAGRQPGPRASAGDGAGSQGS